MTEKLYTEAEYQEGIARAVKERLNRVQGAGVRSPKSRFHLLTNLAGSELLEQIKAQAATASNGNQIEALARAYALVVHGSEDQ